MLGDRLARIRDGAAKRIPPERAAIMQAATQALRDAGAVEQAIGVGDRLPAFALANSHGEEIRSDDLLARGPLVMTVFRGSW